MMQRYEQTPSFTPPNSRARFENYHQPARRNDKVNATLLDGILYITVPSGKNLQFKILNGKFNISAELADQFKMEVDKVAPGSIITFQFPFDMQFIIPVTPQLPQSLFKI